MRNSQTDEQILKDYERKGEEILKKMFQVLIRTQRKVDDVAYRKTLERIEKEKQ